MNKDDGTREGDLVEINWQEKGMWYPGTVTKVLDNGTFDVEYDEGTKEHNVRPYNIRGRGGDYDYDGKGSDYFKGKGKGKHKGKGDFEYKGKGFKGDFKGKGKKGKEGKVTPTLALRGVDRFESWDGPKSAICVDNDVIGLIIGSGGDTIRRLEEETQAKITVAKDSSCAPDEKKRMIYVTGDSDEIVEDARKKVCEIRDSATKRKPHERDRRDDARESGGKGNRRRSPGPRRGARSVGRRKGGGSPRSKRRRSNSRSRSRRSHSRRSVKRSRSRQSRSPQQRKRSRSKRDRSKRRGKARRSRSRRTHKEKKAKKAAKRRRKESSRSSSARSKASRSKRRARGLQAALADDSDGDNDDDKK